MSPNKMNTFTKLIKNVLKIATDCTKAEISESESNKYYTVLKWILPETHSVYFLPPSSTNRQGRIRTNVPIKTTRKKNTQQNKTKNKDNSLQFSPWALWQFLLSFPGYHIYHNLTKYGALNDKPSSRLSFS